jgi:hypothetical protein
VTPKVAWGYLAPVLIMFGGALLLLLLGALLPNGVPRHVASFGTVGDGPRVDGGRCAAVAAHDRGPDRWADLGGRRGGGRRRFLGVLRTG